MVDVYASTFEQWRAQARTLLARRIAPHEISWHQSDAEVDLFAMQDADLVATPPGSVADDQLNTIPRIPRKMMDLLECAACFRVADRWAFLYLVVWRWQRGEKDVLSPADEDGRRLAAIVKAVRREIHDMHAYLRFRECADPEIGPRFIAWYEPAHDILPQVAQHFAGRMGGTSWLIGTPDATALWNGQELHFSGPLLKGPHDTQDAGETLWLRYYKSIFNPARLNMRVMQSHITSRFWKNLPEGVIVPEMVANAAAGAQKVGQLQDLRSRSGAVIPVSAEQAQPLRCAPTLLEQCRRCPLWERATQAVCGEGNPDAQIMLVGEQPGDREDLVGRPFVGPAGQLLDQVFQQSGVDRADVYMTNAVKHFKWEAHGKRRLHKTPAQREVDACRVWLEEEIERVRPRVVVALGLTAAKSILQAPDLKLQSVLGQSRGLGARQLLTVYHPAYVLRLQNEVEKQHAFATMVEGMRMARRIAIEQAG